MKLRIFFVFLLLIFGLVFAGADILEFKAWTEQKMIILRWKTSHEESVQKFVVERSTDNRNFIKIGEVMSRGPGFQYQFEDQKLGRFNSLYYYRLRIVNKDGSNQFTDSLPVISNISSLVRTWGSIKALFR